MHRQLTRKAKDRSVTGRSELLQQLVVAVLSGRTPTPKEYELLFEIARLLVAEAQTDARVFFAERIAPLNNTPHDILIMMANDEVIVASPILRKSPGLTEATLVDLAETLSIAHLAEVAVRDHLTAPVTDVLTRRGDIVVLRRLSMNNTSELSTQSITRMLAAADADNDLCRGMATRNDLPPDQTDHLIQRMAALLRDRIPRKRPASPPPPEPTLSVSIEVDDGKPSPTRLKVPKRADINELIRCVREKTVTLDDVVSQLSDEDRTNDIAVAFARLCELDEIAIMKVLVRKDANGISMVAKALDLRLDTWRSLVDFRKRRLKLSDSEVRFEIRDYKDRSLEESRKTLAQFQTRRASRA
jgi:uncharacterized protein (DUF2336 family)